jgi:adenosylmethionine-8-amino-7-oxononanoate aminotransferase
VLDDELSPWLARALMATLDDVLNQTPTDAHLAPEPPTA